MHKSAGKDAQKCTQGCTKSIAAKRARFHNKESLSAPSIYFFSPPNNMKTILPLLLAISPMASWAEDTVGAVNADGYYVARLPYTESFDNFGGNYDGTSMLPNGWIASGDEPFRTANSSQRDAHTGTYYLVTIETTGPRLDRAYTPFFNVEAGKTYTISYWTWMPGNSFYHTQNNLSLTVGTEQEADFHTSKLQTISYNTGQQWAEQTATYTAAETGLVCFCFTLTTDDQLAGYVGIDDVTITADDQMAPPTADFALTSLSSLMTGTYCCYPGQKVRLTNLSTHATDYHWEMPGCIPSSSDEAEPEVYFTSTDNYTITLTASNKTGEATTTQDIAMEFIDYDTMLALQTFEADSKTIDRSFIPTYASDLEFDWYSGANHYYRCMAQRIDMPDIQECTVTQLNYQLTNYSLLPSTSQTTWFRQQEVPMSIAFYGETDGHPDPDKCFGRYDSTIGKIVGMYGIGLSTFKALELPKPIHTQGTFYVAFEIGDEFIVDSPDLQIGRSQFAIEPFVHRSRVTDMWIKPTTDALAFNPNVTPGQWTLASDFNPEMKGWGIFLYIWGQTTCPNHVGIDSPSIPSPQTLDSTIYDLAGRVLPASQTKGTTAAPRGVVVQQGVKRIW